MDVTWDVKVDVMTVLMVIHAAFATEADAVIVYGYAMKLIVVMFSAIIVVIWVIVKNTNVQKKIIK